VGFAFCGWLLVGTAAAYADDAPPPIDLSGAAARALRLAEELDPKATQTVSKVTTDIVGTVVGLRSPLPEVPGLVDSVTAVLGKKAKPAPAPKPPTYERPTKQASVSGPAKSWLAERTYVPLIQRPAPVHTNVATDIPAPPPVPSGPDGPPCAAPIGASAPVLSPNGPVAVTESALHLLPASNGRFVAAADRHSPADATRPAVSPD
jgi:hypothetical protein